ncbi:hypothetical protein DL96DRAFT_1553422 [Flagelloscypha sp. PMI_526]|nr:hypothetical protein DL96DRAFT_1553422 [Flagelloscypha sp. PMI_526]
MTSFPDIPVDIAREILEFVACIAGPSRFTLSLVSRTVQQWTDPYVLDRVIIKDEDKWDEFVTMLHEKSSTSRMKQAFLFLRIFTVMPHIRESSLPITMEELLQFFPRLEIIYISPLDLTQYIALIQHSVELVLHSGKRGCVAFKVPVTSAIGISPT